jgi:hypothetical protein
MGADIHMVLECRHEGKWIGINDFSYTTIRATNLENSSSYVYFPARDRNYQRFAALAGVRGEGPEPRGIPDDVSDLARMRIDSDGEDGHSHSWLPIVDAARIFEQTGDNPVAAKVAAKLQDEPAPRSAMSRYFGLSYLDEEGGEGPASDYRLVFWFDN